MRLVDHAGAHGAVADHRDHAVVLLPEVARYGEAGRGRHGRARVRGAERVVFAFVALGETGEAAALPQGADAIAAAGEDLVRIGLVADVPDQPVLRRVEHGMEGDRQLDHAQPGAQVAAGDRHRSDGLGPQFIGNLAQLVPVRPRRSAGEAIWSSMGVWE